MYHNIITKFRQTFLLLIYEVQMSVLSKNQSCGTFHQSFIMISKYNITLAKRVSSGANISMDHLYYMEKQFLMMSTRFVEIQERSLRTNNNHFVTTITGSPAFIWHLCIPLIKAQFSQNLIHWLR